MAEDKGIGVKQSIIHYDDEPARPPPKLEVGLLAWLRQNLFGSPADIVVSILMSILVLALVIGFFDWAIRTANWFTIINNQRLFMMERFERSLEWRLALTVLLSALLTGVSFAAWARQSVVRMLTIITLAALVLMAVLPPLINATIPQPKSYLTSGNVDIIDRASSLTPQKHLAFIAQAGETVSIQLAQEEVADVETLSNLAGFSDRAANALGNAARNRLTQIELTSETFDRMVSRELTEALEERTRLAIRTFSRTNDMQASTFEYIGYLGDYFTASEASIAELKAWLKRLREALNGLGNPEDAIQAAASAVEAAVANLTAADPMTAEARAAFMELTAAVQSSAQIEELGERLILDLSEDLIGQPDQADEDEDLIQPVKWEEQFLREMFVRLLTPQSVVDIYDLGQTPMQVAIHNAETFEIVAEGVVSRAGETVSYQIPRDGWYILSKDAAAGETGTGILAVRGIFPIVERTLSASESQFVRLTDNELEIFGLRPQIEGKDAPIIALIDNQFRGLRDLPTYLVHFIPLFLEQIEVLLLPFFITVAWGYILGRALAHLLGEQTLFNSNNSRATVLAAATSPLLILLAYFALLGGNGAMDGLPAMILRIAAAFGTVLLLQRVEAWLNRRNAGDEAEASITRLLIYGWGIYPFAMYLLASGVGGLSGAAIGSMAGGLIWLLLMYFIGLGFIGNAGYLLLIVGFFLQIAQGYVINVVWENWTVDAISSVLIWIALALVGVGLGLLGFVRRGSIDANAKRIGYLLSCLVFIFIFANTNLLSLSGDGSAATMVAVAAALWLGWMFFSGTLHWSSNRIIVGLLLMTYFWMQTWTSVDRWSSIYFIIWLGAGALAFKRGERAQGDKLKWKRDASGPILYRYPERMMGAIALAWFIVLLIIPSIVLGLESQGALQVSPQDLLPLSDKRLWGGLMLTMQLTILGIGASFPIGLLLALGRRSNLTVVKYTCIVYIETVRGVPLITILFMAVLMVPLIDPTLASVENAVRAWVGITMFSAAYLAENVRGGLQSLDTGQTEAAQAIGLSGWHTTLYILLPQALRAVIPALVGQFISLFKDTSLVFIVGLAEITGIAYRVVAQPEFLQRRQETFLYVAIIYFVFSYIMSYISRRVEATGSGAARAQQL